MISAGAAKPTPLSKWKWALGAVMLTVALGVAIHFGALTWVKEQLRDLLVWMGQLGAWAPVLFIAVYVVACVFFIPASVLTLGGGALFGVVRGSIYTSIGATLGATAAFLLGRYLARDRVTKKIAHDPTFTALDRAVEKEGWKIVLLTRLSPVFPFALLNYGFGVTKISASAYVLASWIGMLPATVLYVYLGSLANSSAHETTRVEWVARGVGIVATVLVIIVLTRIAKRALAKRIAA